MVRAPPGCAELSSDMLKAFLFGITVAIAIGPIALLVVSTAMGHGFLAGSRTAFGVALADFTLASIAFTAGEVATAALTGIGPALPVFSALVLVGFGGWMARSGLRPATDGTTERPVASLRPVGTLATLLLTLANPLTIIGFVAFALSGLPRMGLGGIAAHALAVFLGSLIIQLALAGTGAGLSLVLSPSLVRALNLASGLGIVGFGVYGLIAAFQAVA